MKPLTVLSVAYSLATVEPGSIGGAEQVLGAIDRALVAGGHHSIVVACEGSFVAGELCATPAPGPHTPAAFAPAHAAQRRAIAEALARWPVDLIHMHGIDFHRYLPPPGVPALVTLHLPPAWYPGEVFALERPHTYLHCVSESQRRACPRGAPVLPTIENGVPVERGPASVQPRDDVVALGRICPEKGYHLALDAARMAGVRMRLAGRVFAYPEHQRYYREEIRPRLDERRRFLGPVYGGPKRRLLSGARCVLVPSLAPETSSLVAMEALALGTPVVAFASGALADIVEPSVTGYLVRDAVEMAEAIGAARALDRDVCRRVARARFSVARMTSRYLARYRALAGMTARATADATAPTTETLVAAA